MESIGAGIGGWEFYIIVGSQDSKEGSVTASYEQCWMCYGRPEVKGHSLE